MMAHAIGPAPEPLPLPQAHTTWLPSTQAGDEVGVLGVEQCGMDAMSAELVEIIANHNGQKRNPISCDPCIAGAAFYKARELAMAQAYDLPHTLHGESPNALLAFNDCGIPEWWSIEPGSNNCESLARGYSTPRECVAAWVRLPDHSIHVLGLLAFFAEQVRVGAAVYWDALGHPWWCFLSAPVVEAD